MTDIQLLQRELCKGFQVSKTEADSLSVRTPFTYEDGDSVVVFIQPLKDGSFRVDDNGEAAFRLMTEGVDVENDKVQRWIKSLEITYDVYWDKVEDELFTAAASISRLAEATMRVAECSTQMQVLSMLRQNRQVSNFKEEIMEVLQQVEREVNIEARYDFAADIHQQIFVDAYFMSAIPVSVVIATSPERLMEAELLWSTTRQVKDPMKVIAVYEDPSKFNEKQLARAAYYTTKAVQWRNMAKSFHHLVSSQIGGAH